MNIRDISAVDFGEVVEIYNFYIENSVATFEESPIEPFKIQSRVETVVSAGNKWIVAVENNSVIGYAYSSRWHARSAYRYSTEVSAYVSNTHLSKGIGSALYSELFAYVKAQGKHAVIASITVPNQASVALHEKFGMQKVAHFTEVGFKFGQWLDVGYWQGNL